MNFRTEIDIPKYNFTIDYNDRILLMGSCFSDHIGSILCERKFDSKNNPLGITFNPISICNQLAYVLDPESLSIDQLFQRDGLWHHFDFHGSFSEIEKNKVIESITGKLKETKSFLKTCKVVFITLGTATVYKRKESGRIVANNHKFPIEEFIKIRINKDQIVSSFEKVLAGIAEINPEVSFVFTVSPVRYTRDGLIENFRSKATLIMAIDELLAKSNVDYFPAFEIFMDDLRDYRFYGRDLIHPDEEGISYIWECFRKSFFSEKTIKMEAEITRLVQACKHKPIHPESKMHKKFVEKLGEQISEFEKKNPGLDFSEEISNLGLSR